LHTPEVDVAPITEELSPLFIIWGVVETLSGRQAEWKEVLEW